ncbi:Gfo/Idh/MocA family oxidoreductase [Kineosporia mesophila]|uniref:Gfo/Idh/MocA family oxidoreductase n=1 Tax=Kineosporia mesophila TaxID=566012 RepID=A0ABP6ZAH1_9ACTN|nr:Gfo/Idh/MocA family oxidoreductase [Kineosporia mesophila]MCD5351962.1 Gfo/Idh/MocA family oxidoreductase [Kineosporia mesophila]
MNRAFRVGIIGADTKASWAQLSHVPAINALADVELAAVATRHEDSARAAAEAFGARRWYADPPALIEDDDIDIVTVAVRVPAHRSLVEAALKAGKTVYCEAPLGVDLAEVQSLQAAGEGALTVIGLQGRLNPSVRRAAQMIADGAIGRPLTARIVSTTSGMGPATLSSYRYFDEAAAGANLLTITAGHTLDLLEALLGEVSEVEARTPILFPTVQVLDTRSTAKREVPDHADILGGVGDGTVFNASVIGGVAPEEAEFDFVVRGTQGWLRLRGGSLYGVQGGDLTLTASVGFAEPDAPVVPGGGPALNVAEVYTRIAQDLRTGSRTVPDFALATHNSTLIAAVTRAAQSGRRQRVPG